MNRPTIADLAEAAGVSVSTVNRILGGTASVRGATVQRVQAAAERIGFYGIGAIEDRMRKTAPNYRLGFLLQQSKRELYQLFSKKIIAACRDRQNEAVDPLVDFVDLLTPENIAARLMALGRECDAVAVIAADHPVISQTIRELREMGKPVISYITDQSAPERAAYVGTDNWKLGRTAAWLIAQTTQGPGRIAVFIDNHRYQCQDIADASFRSYMREHAQHSIVIDSLPTQEEPDNAYRIVRSLLHEKPDLIGIYVGGGGISGVLRAMRELPPEKQGSIRVVCRDMGSETRRGLSEGLITATLCHPLEQISDELIDVMLDRIGQTSTTSIIQRIVPFEIVTPESVWAS